MTRSAMWFAAAALCLSGCLHAPTPCASSGACGGGRECLANRCVVAGGDPVPQQTRRVVVVPTDVVVVRAGRASPHELEPAVRFGSRRDGATALYLTFDPGALAPSAIESAFLLLEPMPATAPSTRDVALQVARVRDPFSASGLSWLHQPRGEAPHGAGIARSTPPSTLRVDVTELVRSERTRRYSFVIRSSGGTDHGAAYSTGAAGPTPRLELYLRDTARGPAFRENYAQRSRSDRP